MTPTTPREALIGAITDYCTHTGKPTECDVGCGDCAEIVNDCLTALAPWLMEWRPIEEAPKDGTPVIIFSRYEGIAIARWTIGSYSRLEWFAYADGQDAYDSGENKITITAPTHFMPLPQPPKVTE